MREMPSAHDADWQSLLQGVDAVIHLAARAHQHTAGRSLDDLRAVNVEGTLNLARQACEAGVGQFIHLSSIGVLGQSSQAPLAETARPAPQEPYAQSKLEAETALWDLVANTPLSLTVIRPPLVHGPGAPGNFGRLLSWARNGSLLPLGGVTANQRSLVGRANLVDFIQRVLSAPQAAGQTFHVADDGTTSTAALLCTLANAAGHDPKLLRIPPSLLRAGAWLTGRKPLAERLLGSLTVDTDKARNLLDWRPPVSLEQGLRDAVRGDAPPGPAK
jgi:nucleoside-diphosphate-sugar epimerase